MLNLTISESEFTIHRLDPAAQIPAVVLASGFYFVGRTDEELSIVCESSIFVASPKSERGWSFIKVNGPLDFNLQGVLSGISDILAKAGLSICAISTFDTDYIFVRTEVLEEAKTALEKAAYTFV